MKKLSFGLIVINLLLIAVASFMGLKINKALILPLIGESKVIASENIWFPQVSKAKSFPEVNAQAAFFVETKTGQVLYQKNIHQRLPIASLTKIMTAIVSLERTTMNDQFLVTTQASEMEPDKMYLITGEKLSLEELLVGMFLVSGNDASEVLAEGVTGRREEFIAMMNAKALSLGMNNSLFINPTGLQEDGKVQYSSAYDVALMSRYAIYRWPKLVDITSRPQIYLPPTDTHQGFNLVSGINLVTTYPGVVGFKTGYTPEAGLTLVTLARQGNNEVLGVLLNVPDRRDEARKLLDYSFAQLEDY